MSSPVLKINLKDKNYPKLLKEIYDPPQNLYAVGEIKAEENYPLAIVGTRKVSSYGKQITVSLTKDLVKAGLTIVSGLALGVDGLAHQTTLDNGGRTIAVLGSSPDIIYPPLHRTLAKNIIKNNGAIVSEYPPTTSPTRWTFPARNRIIAGLSLGTLVIEAPEKSGALITAHSALDQGREVFAVPGSIYNPNSAGCNQLIKMGAKAVTKAEDILDAFNLELSEKISETPEPTLPEEKILWKFLSHEPVHIDQLIKSSKFSTSQAIAVLTLMEINGKVKNLGGGNYVKN
ncbi:MAG: DNA-processing protein DprA [Patescibacteria group bacterium]